MFAIILLTVLLLLVYNYLKHVYSYWEQKGFPNLKPIIPFGNLMDVARKKRSFGLAIYDLYNMSKEPFVGVYLFFRPAILVRDAYLAKMMLTSEFNSFHDRGVYCNEKADPLSTNLFALPGEKWKNLRQKLTPTFTSGKLKNMMPTILDVAHKLQERMKISANSNEIVEMKNMSACYVVDIIASVIFGIEVDTINNPDNEFRSVVRNSNREFLTGLRAAATFICPKFLYFFNMSSLPVEVRTFMTRIVKDTIEYREGNNVTRKDFMQLLIDLRKEDAANNRKGLTIEQIAAQVFLFYIAGSESSSATISFCLYELTRNPEFMEKLQCEIDQILTKYNGEVTYESIKEMKFLDLCVLETFRKYPALPILNRECTRDFHIPNSNFTIRKGTTIVISLMGISRNPEYFPDPDEFIPNRFSEEHKNYDENAYFPFGEGPRACIGIRMGQIVVKIGLISLLSKFNFYATNNSDQMEFDSNTVTVDFKDGVELKVSNRTLQAA